MRSSTSGLIDSFFRIKKIAGAPTQLFFAGLPAVVTALSIWSSAIRLSASRPMVASAAVLPPSL